MANPNLLNLVNITAKTNYSNVTTVNTSIVSNSINSNLVYKLNHITVVNNSDSPNYFTVRINRNSNILLLFHPIFLVFEFPGHRFFFLIA